MVEDTGEQYVEKNKSYFLPPSIRCLFVCLFAYLVVRCDIRHGIEGNRFSQVVGAGASSWPLMNQSVRLACFAGQIRQQYLRD